MAFAAFSYYVYRDTCDPIFILSLQPVTILTTFISFCVCINCFFSYPVQILAAFDIAEQADFFKLEENATRKKVKSVLMRSGVIILITCVALIIPDFTIFLDIAGSLGAGVIAFVLPPLMYNKEFENVIPGWKKWTNYLIVLFGGIGCFLSIYSSI